MGIAVSGEVLANGGPSGVSNTGGSKDKPGGSLMKDGEEFTEVSFSNVDFAGTEFCLNVLNELSLSA